MHRRALVLSFVFLLAQNLLWYELGAGPQHWDSAIHLAESLHASRLDAPPTASFFERLLEVSWYYPPFVSYVSAPVHRILGESVLAGLLVTTSFLLLFLGSAYAIAMRLYDRAVGLQTLILLACAPLVIEHSRVFMLDLPLAAMATLAIWLLLVSEGFERLVPSLGLGLVLGLGLLTKWTFPIFVVPPGLYWMMAMRTRTAHSTRNTILALLVALLVAAPWYTRHMLQILIRRGNVLVDGDTTGWQAATYYLRTLPEQISWPLTVLCAFGLVLFVRRHERHGAFLAVWFWGSCVLLSGIGLREPRFAMSLLLPLALAASAGLVAWVRNGRGHTRKLVVGLWTLSTFALAASVSPASGLGQTLGARVLGSAFIRCSGPDARDWRNQDVVRDLARDLGPSPTRRVFCRVIPDHAYFNDATLRLQVLLRRLPVVVTGTSNFPALTDYVVLKIGEPGSVSPSPDRARLTTRILAATDPTSGWLTPLGVYPLPDGSEAKLLRAHPKPLAGENAERMTQRVHDLGQGLLDRYLRPERRYRMDVVVDSDSAASRGRVARIRVRVERGELGDFAFHEQGVMATDVDFEIRGVQLDPQALVHANRLEILSVEELVVSSLRLHADDLRTYLETVVRDWSVDSLSIRSGRLWTRVRHRNAGPTIGLGLDLRLEAGRLCFSVTDLRVGGLSLPVWPLNWWTDAFNPLVGGDPGLPELRLGTLELVRDEIRLDRSAAF